MLLKITHTTDLTYSDLISESVMELRMCPRQEEDQHRLSFELAIGPRTTVTSYFDWLGNQVHAFTVNRFHRQIRIIATSIVESERPRIDPREYADVWPIAPEFLPHDAWDFMNFDGPVCDSASLAALARELGPRAGEPMGQIAYRMLELIYNRFEYRRGLTTSASSITDVLEHKAGVCQDFAHLAIGVARSLKIPARYVSGMIHPDAQKYKGFTHTHAWCEWLFPSVGWVGLDATNHCVISKNFVKVAVGRDYRDVPPNKGVYRGAATESIGVAVASEELDEIPAALAAERTESLPIDSYTEYTVLPDRASIAARQQQQEQQQQEKTATVQQQQQQQ